MTIVLFITLAALQFADGWTTYRILNRGGHERNPIMLALFDRIGVIPALVGMKLLLVAAAIIALLLAPIAAQWAIAVVCIGYGWLVWTNWKQL
jgi:hypothetical protein